MCDETLNWMQVKNWSEAPYWVFNKCTCTQISLPYYGYYKAIKTNITVPSFARTLALLYLLPNFPAGNCYQGVHYPSSIGLVLGMTANNSIAQYPILENIGQYSIPQYQYRSNPIYRAGFLSFVLVFVPYDFEVHWSHNITRGQPLSHMGLILLYVTVL